MKKLLFIICIAAIACNQESKLDQAHRDLKVLSMFKSNLDSMVHIMEVRDGSPVKINWNWDKPMEYPDTREMRIKGDTAQANFDDKLYGTIGGIKTIRKEFMDIAFSLPERDQLLDEYRKLQLEK